MAVQPRAFSYVRFSTPEQMKGDSLRRQVEAAEEYARRHGLTLDTKLTFRDLGVSGFRGRNAEVGRLADFKRAVEDGLVPEGSYLLVENLDRISRQYARKAIRVLEDIVDMGITVVTLSDGRAYDRKTLNEDMTSFILAILTFMRAHEESAVKGKRLKASWEARRKRARETKRPVGTVYPSWLKRENDQWVIVNDKAEVVRRIFARYVSGEGLHKIASDLNAEGVPTLRGAHIWVKSTIARLLDNPAVIGTYVPTEFVSDGNGGTVRTTLDPIEGYFPPIIDRDTWDRVRSMRSQRSVPMDPDRVNPNVVAGLAKCPECGSTMTLRVATKWLRRTRTHTRYRRLYCIRASSGLGCPSGMVNLAHVERTLYANVFRLGGMLPGSDAEVQDRLAKLRAEIADMDRRIENLTNAIAEAPSSRALAASLVTLEGAREAADKEYRALSETASSASLRAVARRMEELAHLVQQGLKKGEVDSIKANALLRQIFDRIVVTRSAMELHWKHAPGAVTTLEILTEGPTVGEAPALVATADIPGPLRATRRMRRAA